MPPAWRRRSSCGAQAVGKRKHRGPEPAIEHPSPPASSAAFLTASNPGISRARSGSTRRSSMLRPSSSRSPRPSAATSAAMLPRFGTIVVERVRAALHEPPRLGRRDFAVRVHDADMKILGQRQRDDIERLIASYQHDAAHHAGRDVIGVRRPGRGPLAFHRARHDVTLRQRPAQQLVHGNSAGRAARARAAEPARKRHLFVQPQPHALTGARAPQHIGRGAPDDVLFGSRLRTPPSPVTSTISTPGRSDSSASSSSPGRLSARPSTSNPGPRLATVAGANTRIRRFIRSFERLSRRLDYEIETPWHGTEHLRSW